MSSLFDTYRHAPEYQWLYRVRALNLDERSESRRHGSFSFYAIRKKVGHRKFKNFQPLDGSVWDVDPSVFYRKSCISIEALKEIARAMIDKEGERFLLDVVHAMKERQVLTSSALTEAALEKLMCLIDLRQPAKIYRPRVYICTGCWPQDEAPLPLSAFNHL